jgi:Protein of unknown function (DUF1194)
MLRRAFGFLCLSAALLLPGSSAAEEPEVDLALALAIDCSFSVDSYEFRIQMAGLGEALMSAEVIEAIRNGPKQKIALTIYQWSDNDFQRVIEPWIIIDGEAAALAVGKRMSNGPRAIAEGGTAMASALIFGAALFNLAPTSTRRVIDMASDGRNNMGSPVNEARDKVVQRGITINGLAIANEWPTLDAYMQNHVAGGPGHFVIKANTYDDFGAAMAKKLVREISGPGST